MTIMTMKVLAYGCQILMFILPILIVWKNRKPYYRQRQKLHIPTLALYLLGILMIWLLIQLSVYFTNTYLQAELDVFDLDGNDVFTSEEYSEAQAVAFNKVVADTGRALAPITGAVFAVGYMLMLLVFFKIIGFFKQRLLAKFAKSDQA